MGNSFWVAKWTGFMEHDCSVNRVMYVAQMSTKSAKLVCGNCHKEYFYRFVPLNSFTLKQKEFLEDLKKEVDNSSTPLV